MKKNILIITLLLVALGSQAKPLKVLLITGHTDKYHNWQVTSSYLKALLDAQGIFETDLSVMNSDGTFPNDSTPTFSNYQALVLNFDEVKWSESTKMAFEQYVKNGGGVVFVHEANNTFPDWKEYNLISGLGGWGGRNEKNGPYYYWKEDKYVTDNSPGIGGKHGKRVPFTVNVRDTKHPITKGLPLKWLHINDELYGNLRGPAQNIHVLATAFSEKASGGTGKEEPVLFTVRYGKGRIFQTVMGHTGTDFCESVQESGFQATFSRGTEWVATSKVKQKLPKDISTETNAVLHNLDYLKTIEK